MATPRPALAAWAKAAVLVLSNRGWGARPCQLFYGGRGGKAPRGRRQDQVLLIEGLGPQPFRNPQAVYNAHIQLVLRQQALDFVGVGHQGPQPHLWVFLTEAPQNLGQARLAKADVCPHPQGQRPPLAQGFLRLLEPPQHVLSRGKQGLPGRGQVDAAVHALEKGHAIMAFQLFNSQAHSGWLKLRKRHTSTKMVKCFLVIGTSCVFYMEFNIQSILS